MKQIIQRHIQLLLLKRSLEVGSFLQLCKRTKITYVHNILIYG